MLDIASPVARLQPPLSAQISRRDRRAGYDQHHRVHLLIRKAMKIRSHKERLK